MLARLAKPVGQPLVIIAALQDKDIMLLAHNFGLFGLSRPSCAAHDLSETSVDYCWQEIPICTLMKVSGLLDMALSLHVMLVSGSQHLKHRLILLRGHVDLLSG